MKSGLKASQQRRAATLADVGRAAGVSATAASAVLNRAQSRWRASPETRARILAAAAELDYRPNAAAQALANRRMNTIGVVAVVEGGELNDYFLEVFNGIIAAATRREHTTTVFTLPSWSRAPSRLNEICDGRVDGLILLAPTFAAFDARLPAHTPCVSIHANRELRGMVNIETDEERGARNLVRHLLDWGHQRIMHLAGPAGLIGAERRVRGYRQALVEGGIPFDPGLLVTAGYTTLLGREALHCWLRRHSGQPLPHAVFCANDAVAIGCLEAFAEAGLRVPEDVSVTGFDDTFIARSIVPQLTSVRQPLRDMGTRAVELLLQRIERGGMVAPDVAGPVVFATEVVSRASVGPRPTVERLVGAGDFAAPCAGCPR